jgi:type IV pilus assembly protein PilA
LLLHTSYSSDPSQTQTAVRPRSPQRDRVRSSAGFTLVELLVVVLIVSVLVAIAIPMFFGPQESAVDAQAKSLVGTAATTAVAIGSDNEGSYAEVSRAKLHSEEPTIRIANSSSEAYISRAKGDNSGYAVTARATNGDEFTITDAAGETTRTCVSRLSKTGCDGAKESRW